MPRIVLVALALAVMATGYQGVRGQNDDVALDIVDVDGALRPALGSAHSILDVNGYFP